MGRRAILNLTSTKKKDTMVGVNLKQTPGEPNFAVQMGSTYNFLLWCPTARAKAGRGVDSNMARSADQVFWKGVSERIHLETDGSDPWTWRRIVFQKKQRFDVEVVDETNYVTRQQDIDAVLPATGQIPPNPYLLEGLIRYGRSLEPLPAPQYESVARQVFQGTRGVDYVEYVTAKTNPSTITVLRDKTVQIRSGNESGVMRDVKWWLPLNKRMQYFSQESGSLQITSEFADFANGKDGLMDDVYILDLFAQLTDAPGNITMSTTTTAYWHEK